jgi:long-chain acyl-CoA synthetase
MKNEQTLTFPALFEESLKKYGKESFLSFVGETPLTFEQVGQKVDAVLALLEQQGIQKGDKVAILSANMPNWGIAYLAIANMGAVVVPLLPDFHVDELKTIVDHSGAKGVFVSKKLRSKLQKIDCKNLATCINIEDFSIMHSAVGVSETELLKPEQKPEVHEDDLVAIIYTSGTTGKSKGVMLSHKNICFNALKGKVVQPIGPKDRMLSILPLSHTYENTLGFVLPMLGGACVYYLKQIASPAVLLPAMKEVRPTIMLSVPLILEKIFRLRVLPKLTKTPVMRAMYKVPAMRKVLHRAAGKKLYQSFGGELVFFGIGGAKLDKTVEKFLSDAKFPYAIGYGLTETAPLLAGADAKNTRLQSTGPAIEEIELIINKPDPVTQEGEIWTKGPNVMKGYYNEPKLTAEVMTEDGWFKTGDLGSFDSEGNLYIKGRLKNMIVGSSGENIYPEEIESVINNFRFVLESVVVQQKGKLVALVHFNREELDAKFNDLKEEIHDIIDRKIEELQTELHQHVNARVNKFSQLKAIVVYAEPFEKTATQKIKRFVYS